MKLPSVARQLLHWGLQPICKDAPDTGLKDDKLTGQKELLRFTVTEAPGGTHTKSSGAPVLSHAAVSMPAMGQGSVELPVLLVLARAGCSGCILGQIFPDLLPQGHGLFCCFAGVGALHPGGAELPLSRQWTRLDKVVSLGRHEPAALWGHSAAWYSAVSGHINQLKQGSLRLGCWG